MHKKTLNVSCYRISYLVNTCYYLSDCRHLSGCEVVVSQKFWLHFSDGQWCCWPSFLVLISHLHICFGEMSVQILCPTFNWVIRFYYWVFIVLCVFCIQVPYRWMICRNSVPFFGLSFSFSCWYVLKHISFGFDNVKFICFFPCCASNVIYRKPSPNPRSWRCKNML